MSVNASSSSFGYHCFNAKGGALLSWIFIAFHFTLIVPLSLLVFCLGLQRWRRRPSATSSHSDVFTYHWAAMELIFVFGVTGFVCGRLLGLPALETLGFFGMSVFIPGQMTFHVLTCVERYLAVAHPIAYLGLKRAGGVRIRNVSIGCVWLLYCGWNALTAAYAPTLPYAEVLSVLLFFLCVVTFCSLSVLWVLYHPGPGDVAGNRGRVDPSKQRAFHTILAVAAVLWLYFLGLPVSVAVDKADLLSYDDGCLVLLSGNLYGLPTSLVLPLLFLQRAGKNALWPLKRL